MQQTVSFRQSVASLCFRVKIAFIGCFHPVFLRANNKNGFKFVKKMPHTSYSIWHVHFFLKLKCAGSSE